MKKEEHIKFIDTIDAKAEKAKSATYNEMEKMPKRLASQSNGNVNKFLTLIKKSRKIAT